jgi:ankyrin repeat protein
LLTKLVLTAGLSPDQARFVRSLRYAEADVDQALMFDRIPSPEAGTCHWITQNPTFVNWAQGVSTRLLWIYGSAGSGKSVLVKYIIHLFRRQIQKAVGAKPSRTHDRAVAFVFCDSKLSTQGSATSVLRSLLYQMIVSHPRLCRYIDQQYLKEPMYNPSAEILSEWLSAVILQARGIRFWLVVDALDELPDQAATLLRRSLHSIIRNDLVGRLQVLVSDRSGPPLSLTKTGKLVSFLNLDVKEVHEDVRRYIENILEKFQSDHDIPEALTKQIELGILTQSKGVFLFASLNWSAFCEGVSYWTRSKILSRLNELRNLPSNFEALYCSLFSKVPQDLRPLLRKLFMLLLVARQPLSLTQIQFAVSITPRNLSFQDVKDDLSFNLDRVLRQYGSPFLKLDRPNEIQFRHQSVKEVLQRSSKIEEHQTILREFRASTTACEYLANEICLKVLQFRDWQGISCFTMAADEPTENYQHKSTLGKALDLNGFPFLHYAIKHWPSHLKHVQDEPEVVQSASSFILSKSFTYFRIHRSPWSAEERMVKFDRGLPFRVDTPSLHALIQMGDFAAVAKCLISSGEDPNRLDADDMTPLRWALVRERRQIIRLLLLDYKVNPNEGAAGRDKPIHVCIDRMFASSDVFTMLLSLSLVDVNSKGFNGETALHRILYGGSRLEPWLDVLLERKDISPNVKDDNGVTPLIAVLSMGADEAAALKLLRFPAGNLDISGTDKNGTNALSLASIRGWVEVRKVLQARDRSQVYSVSGDGMNILTRAAFFGQKNALMSLLRDTSAADVRRLSNLGRFNLMNLCAQQDWEDLVELLRTQFGLESQEQDTRGRTVLHWAALSGWTYAENLFSSKQRAMVNTQDFDGCTALHLAAENRNLSAARFLLKEGANRLLKDKYGRTPAHTAAEFGSRAILELLLNSPISEFGRDVNGRALLHYIATWEWRPVLVHFIETKRPLINVVDKRRRTPLHLAAIYGNLQIAETLLVKGAEIDRRDSLGFTAALHTIQQGHFELLEVLLKHGTDIHRCDGFGRTAMQIALAAPYYEIARLLKTRGVPHPSSNGKERPTDMLTPNISETGHLSVINGVPRAHRIAPRFLSLQLSYPPKEPDGDPDHDRVEMFPVAGGHNSGEGLHIVAQHGDEPGLLRYITEKVDLNRPDDRGWTPLHLAVLNGHQATVDLLIAAGCDCAVGNACGGWTAFHVAALMNHVQIGKRILCGNNAPPVDVECHDGTTAALVAARLAHVKFLDFCLERGADPNRVDSRGYPILHWAVLSQSLAAVEVAISHGVDPSSVQGSDGSTALHLASALQLTPMIALLLDCHSPGSTLSPLQRVALYGICQGHLRLSQNSPSFRLYWSRSHWVENQVDPSENPNFDLIKKRKPHLLRYEQAELAEYFLLIDQPSVAASLLKQGVRPKNPSHMLKYPTTVENLEILWRYGASPTFRFEDGSNALHHWLRPQRDKEARFMGTGGLAGYSDDWPHPEFDGWSHPDFDGCRWLVDHGLDVNAQDINGETPFMTLAGHSSMPPHPYEYNCAEMLIDVGVYLNLRRNDGMTVLDIAKKNGAYFIVHMVKAAIKVGPK